MANKTFLGGAAFNVTIDAETHVDFVYRHNAVHRFDRPMAFLASNTSPYMWLVDELHEIRQRVDPIPANLEWRLLAVGPGPCNRLNPAEQGAPMASDAALDRRNSCIRRPPSVLVAVLAGDFVDACMHAMAERDWLFDIRTRSPRPLRKGDGDDSARKQEQRERDQ